MAGNGGAKASDNCACQIIIMAMVFLLQFLSDHSAGLPSGLERDCSLLTEDFPRILLPHLSSIHTS